MQSLTVSHCHRNEKGSCNRGDRLRDGLRDAICRVVFGERCSFSFTGCTWDSATFASDGELDRGPRSLSLLSETRLSAARLAFGASLEF